MKITESQLRKIVKRMLHEEAGDDKASKGPTVPGSEQVNVKFNPKVLLAALGAEKEMDVSALQTAITNATSGKRTPKDNAIISDLFIKLLDAPNKSKALSALSSIKAAS